MIERYSRTRMKSIWSDQNKYDIWLQIEIAVCEAWAKTGLITAEEMDKIRHAKYDFSVFQETLEKTKHDMTAFLHSVTANMGPEGRWIHQGLTTSDIWDTATSIQLMQSSKVIDQELILLSNNLKEKAQRYKYSLMIGRTHGGHAEPITFGLKMALWWDEISRSRKRLSEA